MRRRIVTVLGPVLAGAGLVAGVVSLALPWARYRVVGTALGQAPVAEDGNAAVFSIPGGSLYVLAVLVLAGLLALAALGTGWMPAVALYVAPVVGLVTAFAVVLLAGSVDAAGGFVTAAGMADVRVTADTGPGVWVGLPAGPLLGFGAALVGLARLRATEQATVM